MSNTTNTNKSVRVKRSASSLVFPDTPFTIRDLLRSKRGRIPYATIYQRVKKAEKLGKLRPVGLKQPHAVTRGRRQTIYDKVQAAVSAATT